MRVLPRADAPEIADKLNDRASAGTPSIANRGYAATREQAMAAFKARLIKAPKD